MPFFLQYNKHIGCYGKRSRFQLAKLMQHYNPLTDLNNRNLLVLCVTTQNKLNFIIPFVDANIQVHLNKLECRGKVNLFQ